MSELAKIAYEFFRLVDMKNDSEAVTNSIEAMLDC